ECAPADDDAAEELRDARRLVEAGDVQRDGVAAGADQDELLPELEVVPLRERLLHERAAARELAQGRRGRAALPLEVVEPVHGPRVDAVDVHLRPADEAAVAEDGRRARDARRLDYGVAGGRREARPAVLRRHDPL